MEREWIERFGGEEQEGMNLGYGPINAPPGPHLAPMEDELLLDWAELGHDIDFCLDRIYRIDCEMQVDPGSRPR